MKTILVPTDFSPIAANAVEYAASLVQPKGGRLLLVHTVGFSTAVAPEGVALLPFDAQLIEDAEEALLFMARNLREDYGFSFEVETFCLYGPLIPLLNEQIKTQAVDLVVMGTHGQSNLLDTLMGTNASSFIREALCPVLVVPATATFSPLRHIAYASDFENEETVYLKQLFQLASFLKSEVNIINIKSEKQLDLVSDNQVLKSIHKQFPDNTYRIAQFQNDDVISGLKEFVQDKQMDVLAVSIQDRDWLEELFHHSITKQLALQAFVPLLALPAAPYQFQNQRSVTKKTAPVL